MLVATPRGPMLKPILIVDDDADMRRVLRDALGPLGPIAEAAGGADALRVLRAGPARLVILDVAMPGLGGLEVLAEALDLRPGLLVVMLTGDTDIESARFALDLGARAYVTKPFDAAFLRAEISRQLQAGSRPRGERPPWRLLDDADPGPS